jgi:predicted metal-dependent hydrolase
MLESGLTNAINSILFILRIVIQMISPQIIRSNRKTLSLSINENADLVVRAPRRVSDNEIQKFISEKSAWIDNKQRLIKARLKDNENQHSSLLCLYLGSLYPFKIDNSAVEPISFDGHVFTIVNVNRERISLPLKSWYKKRFIEVALPRLSYFSDKHKLKVNQVRVKEQKTLWGSCSSKNNINLNYLLIMAPMKVIDYVILHELVHTIHKNHSAKFWQKVETIMPNYKDARYWLKENGHQLRRL